MRPQPPVRALALGLWLVLLQATAGAGRSDDDAWRAVETLRQALAADSPLTAEFTQTFTPSGFAEGDTETGTLSIDLPDCLRWDYRKPFAKSYLVCGDTAYTWNEGETTGRRVPIEGDDRAGLDLLRLDTAALVESFAANRRMAASGLEVELAPRRAEATIRNATLEISSDGRRLAALAFTDIDGNRTLFRLEDYRRAAGGRLAPPAELEWIEE